MNNNKLTAELIPIKELFTNNSSYLVPIYQRNYSWRAAQIEQLINDIQDAAEQEGDSYFIGNLVVTRNESEGNSSSAQFVVIDGQQRLTTIYLLLTFLEQDGTTLYTEHKGRLQYESRIRATEALQRIGQKSAMPKEPLNKSFFLPMKTEWGRFFSHRVETLVFWLMDLRYLLPFWGFPHSADGLLPSRQ